jgi:hypothetical protein
MPAPRLAMALNKPSSSEWRRRRRRRRREGGFLDFQKMSSCVLSVYF